MWKEYDAGKKLANVRRIAPESAFPHEIYIVDKVTGERFRWGAYKPLQSTRVARINGRLGDLLHAKVGLNLGIRDDPWYVNTRRFLEETADYLMERNTDSTPFFTFEGLDHVELIRAEEGEPPSSEQT